MFLCHPFSARIPQVIKKLILTSESHVCFWDTNLWWPRSFNVWFNSIRGLDSIGPVSTEQVTTTVLFFRINTLLTVSFTLHSAIGHDVLMNLIKAFAALPCEASGGLKIITLTTVNKHGNLFFPSESEDQWNLYN